MLLHEIKAFETDPYSPVAIASVYQYDNHPVINQKIVLPVSQVSNSFDKISPLAITINGIVIGYLIFTKDRDSIPFNIMSDYEFLAYLTVGDYSIYNTITEFKFDSDFLVLEENFMIEYTMDFKNTSSLWGGFLHEMPPYSPVSRYKKNMGSLEVGNKLKAFDLYSYESIVRAIEQPYAFERYLKLYHLLELQFDYMVIQKIKSLSLPQDANKIGALLKEFSDKEMDRLTDLVESACKNIASLESALARVSQFPQIAEEIFITFGKSKQEVHLTNLDKFRDVVQSGSFTTQNFTALKVPGYKNHTKLIINICAYWIYRIRCSIAHNKIGEYLLSWNDENFIVEFGEPLLKEVLLQLYSVAP